MPLIQNSIELSNRLDSIARECYYGIKKWQEDERNYDVGAHFRRILEILGVTKPEEVGLSNSILRSN